jgi:hypothetical protein
MLKQAARGGLDTREAYLVKRVSGLTFHVSSVDPQPETCNVKLDAANEADSLFEHPAN